MYLLFTRINNLELPIDLQLKLFDNTVLPILTYACEVWGYENNDIIERVHSEFLRKITKARKSTPLYMLYAELGRYPIQITIDTRIIQFWNKLVTGKVSKLSHILYQVSRTNLGRSSKQINHVTKIFENTGKYNIWLKQSRLNNTNVHKTIKQSLLDQFLQSWDEQTQLSSKRKNYRLFKSNILFENYLTILPKSSYLQLIKFRTANHKLPIETGRWNNTDISERKCTKCNANDLGDEFHYLFQWPYFKTDRIRLLDNSYYMRPNILKFSQLMNSNNPKVLSKLSVFVKIIMKAFNT